MVKSGSTTVSVVASPVQIVIYNPSVSQGAVLQWAAAGLTPNSTEDNQVITNGGVVLDLGTLATDSNGHVFGSFTVGNNIPLGVNTLKVIDLTTGQSGTLTFTVTS